MLTAPVDLVVHGWLRWLESALAISKVLFFLRVPPLMVPILLIST